MSFVNSKFSGIITKVDPDQLEIDITTINSESLVIFHKGVYSPEEFTDTNILKNFNVGQIVMGIISSDNDGKYFYVDITA